MNDREKFIMRAALIYLQSNRDDVNDVFHNLCPYCEADCPEMDGETGCDGWLGDIDGLAKDFQVLSVNGDEGELIKEDEVGNLLMTLQ
jgi:hypothetical protein